MSISNVDVGDPVGVFVSKYCREEKIPKDIMQRSDYVYIYVRNGIVDKVCYYSKIPKTFNRFVKGTDLVNDNGRVWHTPTRKYMLWLGETKLEEDVCYFVQYKHTGSSSVYKAYAPGKIPVKRFTDRFTSDEPKNRAWYFSEEGQEEVVPERYSPSQTENQPSVDTDEPSAETQPGSVPESPASHEQTDDSTPCNSQ